MNSNDVAVTRNLISFLEKSPTAFQAVDQVEERLKQAGFVPLAEEILPGGRYYVTKNRSALVAFSVPENADSFQIAAAHTDSPMFRLKPEYETENGSYVRLNTEPYGGMNLSSWLDRPLSVAGRVIVRRNGGLETRSVVLNRDLLLIPSVCIHFNRSVNNGYSYNPAVDLPPLAASSGHKGELRLLVAEAAGVLPEEIVGSDLFVYNRMPGTVWGTDEEFFSAPRIDDLMCVYGMLEGFCRAGRDKAVCVLAVFDNEETGSGTKQGAGSMFLRGVLNRIAGALGKDPDRMLESSLMVSADNGHALHPNHPELSDGQNAPKMNGGVVLKTNANQKYATDGVSAALFSEICAKAGVPLQVFANRSDIGGGSTLGTIADQTVPVNTVDIGMAQLAMHSAYETAGCADTSHLIRACEAFFNTAVVCHRDGVYSLR